MGREDIYLGFMIRCCLAMAHLVKRGTASWGNDELELYDLLDSFEYDDELLR